MMNSEMNSAMPASTWFGGTFCTPSALRVSPRTTKTFVKQVHINNRAGATDSRVIARMTVRDVLGLPTRPPRSTLTPVGPAGDDGPFGPLGAVAALAGPAPA